MKGSMVFNSDHLENSLMASENPLINQIYGLRVRWGKISMMGQSESDDIFVCRMKAKELMTTGSSVLLYLFHQKIKKCSSFHHGLLNFWHTNKNS